jgi:UDP-glucuronate decarboxylase
MNGNHIGPINLGNPHEYTISQLAERVQALVDPSSKVVYEPMPSDDPRKRKPDISKAQLYLDQWTPKIQLEEGLQKTIADFAMRQKRGDF